MTSPAMNRNFVKKKNSKPKPLLINNSPTITEVGEISKKPRFTQQLNMPPINIEDETSLIKFSNNNDDLIYEKKKKRGILFEPLIISKQLVFKNRIKIIEDFMKKKRKDITKCPKLKTKGKGGFGSVGMDENDGKFKKILPNLLGPYLETRKEKDFKWMFNRFTNFCEHMKKFSKEAKKFFPNNIIDYGIKKCNYCLLSKPGEPPVNSIILELDQIGEANFRQMIKEELNKDDIDSIDSIMTQLYYITLKLNSENLWHNDFKPANIMIIKTPEDITYEGIMIDDTEILLKVKKDNYIPVIIDYDFCSFKHLGQFNICPVMREDLDFAEEIMGDFSYMTCKLKQYLGKKANDLWEIAPTLLKYIKSSQELVDFLKMIKEKGEVIIIEGESSEIVEGGKGKRRKTKKVRKHKGIVQTGGNKGRLRKGYRYSGKKLKSGLPQIIKCKSKRC
ncbi:uncharacterized protein METZ01_LOCUS81368 [marine metagenome]|uniref:Protein kinase domain-containing protein n=1 Tax=marine metagenome TaxID=408172 RepID=A0A381UKL0_9ZZZZ